jgi:3'-phosphoadenosine 5'-phosphosulfate sulfotransferase (PAPS reductase)/FAD synthetase
MNPFRIPTPSTVQFSGGRTSAYMLRRILDAYDGKLPADVDVIFCNTGLEHPETLRFIAEVAINWEVNVRWLEFDIDPEGKRTFQEVSYETASRNGEPFSKLLADCPILPNVRKRICTIELKIRTTSRYMRTKYGHGNYFRVLGLRADEPRRVARLRGDTSIEEPIAPLAEAGISKSDVHQFWKNSPFDLRLPMDNHAFGNCVGCFLKSKSKIQFLMREMPEHFRWWIDAEKQFDGRTRDWTGARFRIDRPSYSDLFSAVGDEMHLTFDEDVQDCSCTD